MSFLGARRSTYCPLGKRGRGSGRLGVSSVPAPCSVAAETSSPCPWRRGSAGSTRGRPCCLTRRTAGPSGRPSPVRGPGGGDLAARGGRGRLGSRAETLRAEGSTTVPAVAPRRCLALRTGTRTASQGRRARTLRQTPIASRPCARRCARARIRWTPTAAGASAEAALRQLAPLGLSTPSSRARRPASWPSSGDGRPGADRGGRVRAQVRTAEVARSAPPTCSC